MIIYKKIEYKEEKKPIKIIIEDNKLYIDGCLYIIKNKEDILRIIDNYLKG